MGQPQITGDATLSQGASIALTQVGNDIAIAFTGAGIPASLIPLVDCTLTLGEDVTPLRWNGAALCGLLHIENRANLNALVIGDADEEGGDIVVYEDVVGNQALNFDADVATIIMGNATTGLGQVIINQYGSLSGGQAALETKSTNPLGIGVDFHIYLDPFETTTNYPTIKFRYNDTPYGGGSDLFSYIFASGSWINIYDPVIGGGIVVDESAGVVYIGGGAIIDLATVTIGSLTIDITTGNVTSNLTVQNPQEIYYKTQTLDARFVNVTGDTMTGNLRNNSSIAINVPAAPSSSKLRVFEVGTINPGGTIFYVEEMDYSNATLGKNLALLAAFASPVSGWGLNLNTYNVTNLYGVYSTPTIRNTVALASTVTDYIGFEAQAEFGSSLGAVNVTRQTFARLRTVTPVANINVTTQRGIWVQGLGINVAVAGTALGLDIEAITAGATKRGVRIQGTEYPALQCGLSVAEGGAEGGDIVVYQDAVGTITFQVDADLPAVQGPYWTGDYGPAWAGLALPAAPNGSLHVVYNSNAGVLATRLYGRSNGVWVSVALA